MIKVDRLSLAHPYSGQSSPGISVSSKNPQSRNPAARSLSPQLSTLAL